MTHVSSTSILRMLERLEGVCMHGFELHVGGKIAAEGYWKPFCKGQPHRMYSVSKSVVSIAIGILMSEGKLSLEDKITDYFPEYVPDAPDGRLMRLTIRDMLRMATCHANTTYREGVDDNWEKTFFTVPPTHESGTMFNYDTSCSQVLAALVQKLSGQPLLDFLRERLFKPLGFEDEVRWLKDPSGVPQGGTGLIMSLRDLGKLGRCVMNGGDGLIPADYIRQATSRQILTYAQTPREEQYGYGYQFWRMRCGWAMYGMGGQYVIACPEKDVMLCTIADTRLQGNVQMICDAFFEEIVAHVGEEGNPADDARLQAALSNLKVLAVKHCGGEWISDTERYAMQGDSPLQQVELSADSMTLYWQDKTERLHWEGFGKCTPGQWSDGVPTLTSAGLTEDGALHVRVQQIGDAPCGAEIACYRKEGSISLRMRKCSNPATNRYEGIFWGVKV